MPGSLVYTSRHSAATRLDDMGSVNRRVDSGARGDVENEVVIVAAAMPQLYVVSIDTRPDGGRGGEVERRVGHRRQLAGRNQRCIDGCVAIVIDAELVAQDVAAGRHVEVRVLGQVDRGRRVGNGVVVDDQLIVVGEPIGDRDIERTWVAFLAVRAPVGESNLVRPKGFATPKHLVEASIATVQMVGVVVRGQGANRPVDGEATSGDAVRIASDHGTEVRAVAKVAVERVVAQSDVGKLTVAIGHLDGLQDGAVLDGSYLEAVGVGQPEQPNVAPVRQRPERLRRAAADGCRAVSVVTR